MRYLTLSPAYGREYKSGKAVREDWDAELDFVIESMGPDCGRYVNKSQLVKDKSYSAVNIRYKRMTQVVVIKL